MENKITKKQKQNIENLCRSMVWNETQKHTMFRILIRKDKTDDLTRKEANGFREILLAIKRVKTWKGNDRDSINEKQDKYIESLRRIVGFAPDDIIILLRMLSGDKYKRLKDFKMRDGAKLINLLEQIRSEYWQLGRII